MYILTLSNAERLAYNKLKYENTIHNTSGGLCKIIKYNKAHDVVVEFENGYVGSFQLRKILNGNVRNPYHENFKLVGVGVCDISTKGLERLHNVWSGVVYRTTGRVETTTYKDAKICDSWLVFSNFVKDLEGMVGFKHGNDFDWHLDKDLLIKGNKLYSKETCCLVPREVNNLLINSKKDCSISKQGVHWSNSKNRFVAQLSTSEGRKFLGHFKDEQSAYDAYKKAKESHVKLVANKYKGVIDHRVYENLMSWELTDE